MQKRMNVYLSFDIEVWCPGWKNLDENFARSFERYVYGHSARGDYALPKTLEILARHGLKGVFFVEPLFAARFGIEHLATVTDLIRSAGHDIELHLHPEWTDEIRPLPLAGATRKRQHMYLYSRQEQTELVRLGIDLLAQVGCARVNAFRAGGFACNSDTFGALAANGIAVDSSLNGVYANSGTDLRSTLDVFIPQRYQGLTLLPITVFRDGTGRLRPAQVGACSYAEMRAVLDAGHASGVRHFMLLSHNFEMLRQNSSRPDGIVVARFEALCRYLAANPERFHVSTLDSTPQLAVPASSQALLSAPLSATLRRHGEQLARRMLG